MKIFDGGPEITCMTCQVHLISRMSSLDAKLTSKKIGKLENEIKLLKQQYEKLNNDYKSLLSNTDNEAEPVDNIGTQ